MSDATTIQWASGEPGRKERRAEERAREKERRVAEVNEERAAQGLPPLEPEPSLGGSSHLGSEAGSQAPDSPGSRRGSIASPGSIASASSKKKTKKKNMGTVTEEVTEAGPDSGGGKWIGALGYDEYNAADFDRIWRRPLQDALSRSFSTPAVRLNIHQRRDEGSRIKAVDDTATANDALDRLLDLQFVQSEPGRLRVRLNLQPQDKAHHNAFGNKLGDLLDPEGAQHLITNAISKDLRRNGYLLPKYGLQVNVKKGIPKPLIEPGLPCAKAKAKARSRKQSG